MTISNFLISLNWQHIAESIISTLFISSIVSGFGYLVTKRITRDLRISKEMKSYGFKGVVAMKTHTSREIMDLCDNADRLDLFFISGSQFFSNNEYILKLAMDRGMKIRFLCSQVDTVFLSDLERLEERNRQRNSGSKISDEIEKVLELYDEYLKNGKMEIRFYSTEYRLPFMLVYKKKNKNNVMTIKAFLRVTLPPYNWKSNFALIGERKITEETESSKSNGSEVDFILMMENHFNCVWAVANDKLVKNNSVI